MTANTKPASLIDAPRFAIRPPGGFKVTAAWTVEERLHRIKAMAQRMNEYIQYMCEIGSLTSISSEAKERAVTAFYEKMVAVEKQLSQVHDEFRLV